MSKSSLLTKEIYNKFLQYLFKDTVESLLECD